MGKTAILIGNTRYRSLQDLPCCQSDVQAMKELLEATEKFARISVISDAAADDMKAEIRAVIDVGTAVDELFFYFTGHGYQHEDDFFQNNEQTPFFVFQVTGRETFVDDAHRLDALRSQVIDKAQMSAADESGQQEPATPGIRQLLEVAEQKVATPEVIEGFIDGFFDALIQEVSNDEFSEFFDLDVVEHADFSEPTAEGFIIGHLDLLAHPAISAATQYE